MRSTSATSLRRSPSPPAPKRPPTMLERYPTHYAPMLLDWSTKAVMAGATVPELVTQLLNAAH